jgi:hypothetical protein
MDHLHWQCFLAKLLATATLDCTCLGHLGQCDTDRIVSIYVTLPKVAKARTYLGAVADVLAKITLPM